LNSWIVEDAESEAIEFREAGESAIDGAGREGDRAPPRGGKWHRIEAEHVHEEWKHTGKDMSTEVIDM
jgi:hypothetical protein